MQNDNKNTSCDLVTGSDGVEQQRSAELHTLLEAIVTSSSDAIVGKTCEGIITSWNAGAERIFGYTAQEAIGQSTQILFPAERIAEELHILERITKGEKVQSFDTVRQRKDGTPVDVSVTVSPIMDARGTVIGASKIARDISERIRVEAELRHSEERFRALANGMAQLVWTARADGFIFWYNRRWYEFTGTTAEQMEGWGWQSVHDPEVLPRVMAHWVAAIAGAEAFEMLFPLRGADGHFRQFLTRANPVKDASGLVVLWTGTCTDVNEMKRVEETLRSSEANLVRLNENLREKAVENALISDALYDEKERAQVTLNSIGDGVICTANDGRLSYLNRAAELLTQWTSAEAQGRLLEEVFHVVGQNRAAIPNIMALAAARNIVMQLPALCILIQRDGAEIPIEDSCAPIHDRHGKVKGAVMVFQDVSKSRILSSRLVHQATHDGLTDLPNRNLMGDRLAQAIAAIDRHHTAAAVLYLDVDRFKNINDSLGHGMGDRLLQSIASRLSSCARTSDTVSRIGGDEFVIVMIDIVDERDAAICAEKVLRALRLPFILDPHELHVTASIGIAMCPLDGTEAEAVLRNADSAMYEAKGQGRNNYQFYRKELNESAVARQTLETALRHAIAREQLELHFQPIMDIRSGSVVAVETLLRWRHPTQGLLMPADFMSIAEDSGLIVPIGRWVLHTACAQAREWQLAGMAPLRYAVNLSAVELRAKEFVEGVALIINETNIEPSILELELTETFLMQDAKSTATVLQSLKDLNVRLALDDFGTGYSSLSYMRRFPIDTLKIDRSFVKNIATDAADASVVSAVINMGQSLHMVVVAEGVETQEQLAFLDAQGCQEAQGYLFSAPVAAGKFFPMVNGGEALVLS